MAPAETEGAEAVAEAMLVDRRKYPYRLPDPTSRKDLEYYRDSAHRGYLSHMVEEGHGPSLFFKTPGAGRVDRNKVTSKGGKSLTKSENRVW
jgi:large subunit ribosomal protein L15